MGNCLGSHPINQSSSTTRQVSLPVGVSENISNISSSNTSNISSLNTSIFNILANSQFSAASGSGEAHPTGQILPTPNLRVFTFAELKTATRHFRGDMVLGEGGFGKVYTGWLDDKTTSNKSGSGSIVAVKKLNSESLQGLEEWQSEINFLGRLSHPNLVKLLGYCLEDSELLLVYEFMQRGSLESHLFGIRRNTNTHTRGATVQSLPWDIRVKILIDAAHGLNSLHSLEKQVIYRDFKASNILLDGSYNAKISDFGLATLCPPASKSHVTTRVMGLCGYAAPEYVNTGHLYVKSDVYGFGVVIIEMLTALRAMDPTRQSGKENLVDWIIPYLYDCRKLKTIMDSRLEGKYPSRAAMKIAQLALKCIAPKLKNRPAMQEVVETLEALYAGNENTTEIKKAPRRDRNKDLPPPSASQPRPLPSPRCE